MKKRKIEKDLKVTEKDKDSQLKKVTEESPNLVTEEKTPKKDPPQVSNDVEKSSTQVEESGGNVNKQETQLKVTENNKGLQPANVTEQSTNLVTEKKAPKNNPLQVSNDVEKSSTHVEESGGDVYKQEKQLKVTENYKGLQEEELTEEKEKPFNSKNYGQSPEVEVFLKHLGNSAPGSALKMIEEDRIIVLDKETFDRFNKEYTYLKGNHELLARLCDIIHPFAEDIVEKSKKLKGKNMLQLTAYLTKQIPSYIEMGKKLNKTMKDNESMVNDFYQFNLLMKSLVESEKANKALLK